MREIDINIEGYNENGICVGCLNHERPLYNVKEFERYYKLLAEIEIPPELTVRICFECSAAVKHIFKFESMVRESFDFLLAYSRKNQFLESVKDFALVAKKRLTSEELFNISFEQNKTREDTSISKVEIKNESDVNADDSFDMEDDIFIPDIKEESLKVDSANNFDDEDDDISLTVLKEKIDSEDKDGKKRKIKSGKNKRDLNNGFPAGMVEVLKVDLQTLQLIRMEDFADENDKSERNRCEFCLRCFQTASLLDGHLNTKHKPKSDKFKECPMCNVYLSPEHMANHAKSHRSAYQCVLCARRSAFRYCMLRHVRANHATKKKYICSDCGLESKSSGSLFYHKKACRATSKPHCDCCGKVYANKITLANHLNAMLGLKKPNAIAEQKTVCPDCNKVFNSRKSYKAHSVRHTNMKHPCPVCGALFLWKRNLARHLRNHRDKDMGTQHKCKQCDKRFNTKDCLSNHMRLKHYELPYVCQHCKRAFSAKSALTDHIDWDHYKKTKYMCKVCSKMFKTSKTLSLHVKRIHEGKGRVEFEGSHLCEICGKDYKTEKRLYSHVWAMHKKRHSPTIQKCPICPATFRWRTSIYKHLKMVHSSENDKINHIKSGPLKKKLLDFYKEKRTHLT